VARRILTRVAVFYFIFHISSLLFASLFIEALWMMASDARYRWCFVLVALVQTPSG
jgi:hypothetical protein